MIRTNILVSQLPKELQKEFSNYIENGFLLGDLDYVIHNDNKPNYANFILSDNGRIYIEIDLVKLISITHLSHRWHCLVATGFDKQGNKVFKYCEIYFIYVII